MSLISSIRARLKHALQRTRKAFSAPALKPRPATFKPRPRPSSGADVLDYAAIKTAIAQDDILSVRTLMARVANAGENEAPKLRGLLNPLGRAGLTALQVKIWGRLLQISPDPESIDRALRLAVSAIQEADVQFRSEGINLLSVIDEIIDHALAVEERPDHWNLLLLKAASATNAAARSPRTLQVLREVIMTLSAKAILGLSETWPPFTPRWLSASYTEMRRIEHYRDAETIMLALMAQKPDNGRYLYRLLDTMLKRGARAAVAEALAEHDAELLSVQELKLLFSRLGKLHRILAAPVATAPDTQAMRMYLALWGWRPHSDLHEVMALRLRRCGRARLAALYLQVEAEDAALSLSTDWAGAAASLNDVHPGLGDDLEPWARARAKDGSALPAEAQALWSRLTSPPYDPSPAERRRLEHHLALWGPFTIRDLAVPRPPLQSVRAKEMLADGGLLITFAPATPRFETRWGPAFESWARIRAGNLSTGEREDGTTQTLMDVAFAVNTQEDYACARLADSLSRRMSDYLLGAPPKPGSIGDEVVRLTVEDRMFPGISQAARLLTHIEANRPSAIMLLATETHYLEALGLAAFLEAKGVAGVGVVFDVEDPTVRARMMEGWRSAPKSVRGLVIGMAKAELDPVPAAILPLDMLWPEVAGPASTAPCRRKRILVSTSLGDNSYFISTLALYNRLKADFDLVIYNGAVHGGDRFRAATGVDEDMLIQRRDADNTLSGTAQPPARRMMERLATRWRGDDLDLYALANIHRLVRTVPAGLDNELNQAHVLRGLIESGDFDLVLTIPGRMICSRSLTLAARAHGIASLDLQAFFISQHPRYHPSIADVYGGITEDQLDVYRAKSPPAWQSVRRIGSLMIGEQLSRVRDLSIDQSRSMAGVLPGQPLIVYGAQHGQGQEGEQIIRLMVRAANTVENSLLIVKLHPRTGPDAVEGLRRLVMAEATGEVRVQRDGDIYALIRAADLVVTQFSNVGLEAAVMGRPVVSVNLTGEDYVVDLARMGVAARAASPEEVIEKVHALLSDDAARQALAESRGAYFDRNPELRDLVAADRVRDLVDETLALRDSATDPVAEAVA